MQSQIGQTSRTKLLLYALVIIGAIFIARLFYLQIIKHDYYVARAQEDQVSQFTVIPKRGSVYARDGGNNVAPLVLNRAVYTAYADPQTVEDKTKVIEIIKKIAGGNLIKGYEDGLNNAELRYAVLARNLSRTQAELIRGEELAGIGLQETSQRVYPEANLAAQLLGFVDTENNGQYGLEGALNDQLRGQPGLLKSVTDVRRIPLTLGKNDVRIPAKDGDDIVLSVDRNIQSYVESALKNGLEKSQAKHGSVIVMNPANGQVMAMANYPTYNPSKYNDVKDYGLFQNRAVSEPYEAGSVIKALTMGVAINEGVVRANTTYNNTGSVQVADTLIQNAIMTDSIGPTSMVDVLRYSLNTGVVFALKQLGGGEITKQARDTLYEYFTNSYMFGKKTGIEQAGEQAGIIISPDEAQGNAVRYSNMAFGQGMDVTMVQVAAAFSALINGGNYYQPTVVAGTLNPDGSVAEKAPTVVKKDVITQQSSATVKEMVHQARAQSFISDNDKDGYELGGKTGTSQIIDPETGKYSDDNSIGTYLGFGASNPAQYVIMVRVVDSKAPGYAGTVAAAPIFGDISNWLIDYLKIKPSN